MVIMKTAIMLTGVMASVPFFMAALQAESVFDAGEKLTLGSMVLGLAGFIVWLLKEHKAERAEASKNHRLEREALTTKLDETHKETRALTDNFRASVEKMTEEHAQASISGHEAAGAIRGEIQVLTAIVRERVQQVKEQESEE